MLLLLPLGVAIVAQLSTLAAMLALFRAHDCDLYLPGGIAFDPTAQNRRLALAACCHLVAALELITWVAYQEQVFPSHHTIARGLASAAQVLVPLLYTVGLVVMTRVGRHLSRFSDLKMTRPDGSILLPRDLLRPLWLAVNAHASMLLIVPPVLLYRSLGHIA